MREHVAGDKRTALMNVEQVQQGNQIWWNKRPMTYDWDRENRFEHGSLAWFDEIDRAFLKGAHLFATRDQPFDRIIPLTFIRGKRVLEIGCGMGLHTETMAKAGAIVTAVDLTETAVKTTRQRLALKGLRAEVQQADAEELPFLDQSFDFVWSWGVIHHSARTGRIVRHIARVLTRDGECRIMVYNREGAAARASIVLEHVLKGGFLKRTVEETLFRTTDGFSARFYVQEQFEDLFRAFFDDVQSEVCGQDADVVPLPRKLREPVLAILPEAYKRAAQARRGAFLLLTAKRPV